MPIMRFRGAVGVMGCVVVSLAMLVGLMSSLAAQTDRSRPALPGSSQPIPRLSEPRIPPLLEDAWTTEQRTVAEVYARDGSVGNALRTLLQVPGLAKAIHPFLNYTSNDSSLSARDREILILRVAWLCQNAYIWADHAGRAASAGLSGSEIRRVAQGPDASGWDPLEAALVRLADELYRNSSVTDATWAAVSDRYDVHNMIDAVMTVAEFTTLSMLFNSVGVQPDAATRERLPSDIPHRLVVPGREPVLTSPRIEPVEGQGFRVGRTIARHPEVAQTWGGNTDFVNRGSPLSPHDRELLILRIGWNCQSEYEWAKHVGSVGRARDHGLAPRRIAEGPNAAGWEPYEIALLNAADELYRDAIVSERTWDTLAERYDPHEMVAIVMTVGTYRFVSMTLNAFGVQLLPEDERFPTL